jgi:outer membrane protein assembly factor BamB
MIKQWHSIKSLAGALVVLLVTQTLQADTWPQWRGPTRDGHDTNRSWPDTLGDRLTPTWQVELDDGYAGPIVSEETVFTVETLDKKYEVVRAFSRKDGTQRWKHQWEGNMSVPFFARSNGSWVRSTPAFDGEFLYVGGMRDVLVCLQASDGKELWRVDFAERYEAPLPGFGMVCSPLIDGDALYVQAGASLIKLNKKNGEEIWRSMKDGGGMWGSIFSSPSIYSVNGRPQLLVQTRKNLAGVNPQDGSVVWEQEIEAFRGMNILTPMLHDGGILTSPYGGKTQMFAISKEHGVSEKWNNKLQGYMSSPVIVDGHAYLHLRNQRLVCINLADGEIKWTSPRGFGKYMSLITNGKKLLALDERGSLYLFRATPESFEQLDTYQVSDQQAWAHLAVADDEIFVRTQKGLHVFTWR